MRERMAWNFLFPTVLAAALGTSGGPVRAAEDDFTYRVVHQFDEATDGPKYPRLLETGVTVASDGALYGVSSAGGRNSAGAAFRVSVQTGEAEVLHAFGKGDTDAANPTSRPEEQRKGYFVGVSRSGGQFGGGMYYRMGPEGHIQSLHDFVQALQPSAPVRAGDGWLYGVHAVGGAHGHGCIYRLGPGGEYEELYSLRSTDGANPLGPLLLARDGLLYGVARNGGKKNHGTLFRVSTDGHFERLHEFNNGRVGSEPNSPLMQTRDGVIYGSASEGGQGFYGTLYRFRPGKDVEVAYTAPPGEPPASSPVEGPDGRLYFMSKPHSASKLMRLDPDTGIAEVVGLVTGSATELTGSLAMGVDGSLYGTTRLPLGGVVFEFKPKQAR